MVGTASISFARAQGITIKGNGEVPDARLSSIRDRNRLLRVDKPSSPPWTVQLTDANESPAQQQRVPVDAGRLDPASTYRPPK